MPASPVAACLTACPGNCLRCIVRSLRSAAGMHCFLTRFYGGPFSRAQAERDGSDTRIANISPATRWRGTTCHSPRPHPILLFCTADSAVRFTGFAAFLVPGLPAERYATLHALDYVNSVATFWYSRIRSDA